MDGDIANGGRGWTSAVVGIAFVLTVALVAHALFSSHGFSPTDEGYYLSNARRVLDGDVPHRDFITLRPAGAYFIFAPVVALAGDSTLWIARFVVLLEFATIAWLWALMIHRQLGEPFGRRLPLVPAAVAFMLTLGWYPLEVTTTVEGYFCFSVGLAVVLGGTPARKTLGYLIIGCAYLCRQNLLFAGGLTLVALGDWRHVRFLIAIIIPGLAYVLWLTALGGLPDFFAQLGAASTNGSSPGGFFAIGIAHWLRQPLLWGGLLGGVAASTLLARRPSTHYSPSHLHVSMGVAIVLAVALGGSAVTLRYGHVSGVPDFRWYSFAVAGLLAGLFAPFWSRLRDPPAGWRLGLCGLGMAWAISFSWATPAPTLALGPIVLLSLGFAVSAQGTSSRIEARRWIGASLMLLTIPLAAIFYQARQGWIALDPPASRLTHRVDGVFPGARHLVTDANTYEYLVDFQDALRRAPTQDVVVGPDLAAYWIRAPRRNPVSINWLFYGELINSSLEQRVLHELNDKRGTYTFIASKVMVTGLADGFQPVPPSWSPVQDSVRARFTKLGETRFFELYR
jgi:hypothetical protein